MPLLRFYDLWQQSRSLGNAAVCVAICLCLPSPPILNRCHKKSIAQTKFGLYFFIEWKRVYYSLLQSILVMRR